MSLRARTAASAALLALLLSACSGTEAEPAEEVGGEEPASEEQAEQVADPLAWGETAEVIGDNGTPLELTPVAVHYATAEEVGGEEGIDAPDNGLYAAVQIEAVALEGPETTTAPIDGGGWAWRQDGQQYSTVDGTATMAPWVGSVPEFTVDAPILPGEDATVGFESFDIPEAGGHLAYTDAAGAMVRWEAPAESDDIPEVEEWIGQ
ncbi:MAG TPA: hypothetical protein VKZ82_28415 [Nonomuraea sp.]|nr:hypothetical protein [Nonomuraea sp.]